jgi:hypothetical protein
MDIEENKRRPRLVSSAKDGINKLHISTQELLRNIHMVD